MQQQHQQDSATEAVVSADTTMWPTSATAHATMPTPQPSSSSSPPLLPLVQVQEDDTSRNELLGIVADWLLTNGLTATAQLLHEEATGQMREAYYGRKAMRGLCRAVEDGNWDAAQRALRKLHHIGPPHTVNALSTPHTTTTVAAVAAAAAATTTMQPLRRATTAVRTAPPPQPGKHALASLSVLVLEQQLLELIGEDGGTRAFAFFMQHIKPLEAVLTAQYVGKLAYVLTCRRVADAADVYAEYRHWTVEAGRARVLAAVRDADAAARRLPRYCHQVHLCDTTCHDDASSCRVRSEGDRGGADKACAARTRLTLQALVNEAMSYRLLRRACADVDARMARVRLTSLLAPVQAQLPPVRPVCHLQLGIARAPRQPLSRACACHTRVAWRGAHEEDDGGAYEYVVTRSRHACRHTRVPVVGGSGDAGVHGVDDDVPSLRGGGDDDVALLARAQLVACEVLLNDDVEVADGAESGDKYAALVVATRHGALLRIDVRYHTHGARRKAREGATASVAATPSCSNEAAQVTLLYQHTCAVRGLCSQGSTLLCWGGTQAVLLDVTDATPMRANGECTSNVRRDTMVHKLTHTSDVHAASLFTHSAAAVTGHVHGTLVFHDTATGTKWNEGNYGTSPICAVVLNHTDTVCFAASCDGVVRAVDVSTGLLLCVLPPPMPTSMSHMTLSSSSTLLLTVYKDMPPRLWDVVAGSMLSTRLDGAEEAAQQCTSAAFAYHDNYILLGTRSGLLTCYDVAASASPHRTSQTVPAHAQHLQDGNDKQADTLQLHDTRQQTWTSSQAAALVRPAQQNASTRLYSTTRLGQDKIVSVAICADMSVSVSSSGEIVLCVQ